MKRRNRIIILISVIIILGGFLVVANTFLDGPDLTLSNKNILVLAGEADEQQGGSCDMAYMFHLENGSIKNYTPVYPGGMQHPTEPCPYNNNTSQHMLLHDCCWYGPEKGMKFAKEIVEYNTGMKADAVIIVHSDAIDAIIDSIRPLKINGEVTNLSAVDIIRENDAYNGYVGSHKGITGKMDRASAIFVLADALAKASKDPIKKGAMIQAAITQYAKGNIMMEPSGSFTKLLTTKGFDSIF